MKENKKWELIAKAHQEYPKGTKINWGSTPKEVTGKYEFYGDACILDDKGCWVYDVAHNQWAEIITDKPVFILRSEDGVDLYEGEDYYGIDFFYGIKNWRYSGCFKVHPDVSPYINNNNNLAKAFSTKEAADAWCKEQNKDKKVTIPIGSAHLIDAVITKYKVTLNRKYGGDHTLSASEIESIWKAYQSLQEPESC